MAQHNRNFDDLNKYDLNSDQPQNSAAKQSAQPNKKENLDDFDQLWNVTIDQTLDFVEKKEKSQVNLASEIALLKKEIKDKDFEVQKFKWQIKEREKELKKIYNELEEIMDLNRTLNSQLELYSYIEKENIELKEIGKYIANKLKDYQTENLKLKKDLKKAEEKLDTCSQGLTKLWGVF